MANIWTVPGVVVRIVDGDTVRLRLDLGWYVQLEANCRILGVNSPEIATQQGLQAAQWAAEQLPAGIRVMYESSQLDKYGRPLGRLTYGNPVMDYGAQLLAAGLAVPYDGGAR